MQKFNKHVVIVGTARSGTSWLSETIATRRRYRMLFEPEHETQTKKGHLLCDKWITVDNASSQVRKYLTQIFYNRVDCDWIAQNSNKKFKSHLWPWLPKKYIIKFVRANLFAEFINMEYGIPVVHLIRNPYDVIRSQQRVKFPWLYDFSHFINQKALVKLIKDRFSFDITNYKALSDVEILATRWCIENVLPLEVFDRYIDRVKVIRYETLVSDIAEFYSLCKELQIEPIDKLEDAYRHPSTKTHQQSKVYSVKNETAQLTLAELESINKILDIFKTRLYTRKTEQ